MNAFKQYYEIGQEKRPLKVIKISVQIYKIVKYRWKGGFTIFLSHSYSYIKCYPQHPRFKQRTQTLVGYFYQE